MDRITEFKRVVFVDEIPQELEYGVLYVSEKHSCVMHLCPDGCGTEISIPIKYGTNPYGWDYQNNNGIITLSPSLLNDGCTNKAHYFIRGNKIIWV